MNERADDLAAQHLQHPPTHCTPKTLPEAPPGYKVGLLYDNSVIMSKFYKTLAKIWHDGLLKSYILQRTNRMQSTFDRVDWEAHRRAVNRLTKYQQIALAKLLHNLANNNSQCPNETMISHDQVFG